ncbi:unnamed protein product [Ectocarpus sp. 12 AP-2014]
MVLAWVSADSHNMGTHADWPPGEVDSALAVRQASQRANLPNPAPVTFVSRPRPLRGGSCEHVDFQQFSLRKTSSVASHATQARSRHGRQHNFYGSDETGLACPIDHEFHSQ